VIVVQTPLRLSFVGGGTDFRQYYAERGGAVLTSAIDKYVFVIVKERFDDLIYVNYSQKEIVDDVASIKHDLVREAMRLTGVTRGVEITTLADIPSEGTGLGSSSSITVGLLNALYAYKGESVGAERLAREACQIEIETLGSPIGVQDQYIAAYGGVRFLSFNHHGVDVERVDLSPLQRRLLDENLLLFYTGMTRKSAEVLQQQKANIKSRQDVLDQMRDLAHQARETLASGDLDGFGAMLRRGWELKRQLASKISNDMIDLALEKAQQAGAVGGKVTGAGGGGFLLVYCPKEHRDRVRAALSGMRELPFRFEQDGSKVIFNYRRPQ